MWGRKRKWLICAGLFLALAPVSPDSGSAIASRGLAALAAAARDPMSLFAARSPGGRGGGATYQSKPGYAAPAAKRPTEKVLSAARERPQPLAAVDPAQLVESIPGAISAPVTNPSANVPGASYPVDLPTGTPGGGPILPIPGGGPGGGGVILPPAPVATPTPEPTAVPEPSTWFLLIMGLGVVGSALRSRNSRRSLSAAS